MIQYFFSILFSLHCDKTYILENGSAPLSMVDEALPDTGEGTGNASAAIKTSWDSSE